MKMERTHEIIKKTGKEIGRSNVMKSLFVYHPQKIELNLETDPD